MASCTTCFDFTVVRAGLLRVAALAGGFGGRAAMGLMATLAILVPLGCRMLLVFVAVAARGDPRATVRLMATHTLGVTLVGLFLLTLVTRLALNRKSSGAVRKPAMTPITFLVTNIGRNHRDLLGMAGLAHPTIVWVFHEFVRFVALFTLGASVERLFGGRGLMATAARFGRAMCFDGGGVWRVATHACAGGSVFGVIRLGALVALHACLIRRALDVMRRVTARALIVLQDFFATDYI